MDETSIQLMRSVVTSVALLFELLLVPNTWVPWPKSKLYREALELVFDFLSVCHDCLEKEPPNEAVSSVPKGGE